MLTPVPKAETTGSTPANSPAPALKPTPRLGEGKQ
jgi:hypothetical protein